MEHVKKKIKLERPNKKWSNEEIKKILNYLRDVPELEAPTAQLYYKKLIEVTGIDASWDLTKWKVRHLKSTFIKACDWKKSTGAGLLEADEGLSSVESKILQLCPHYDDLQHIFGEKIRNECTIEVYDIGLPATDVFGDENYEVLVENNSEASQQLEVICTTVQTPPVTNAVTASTSISAATMASTSTPVSSTSIAKKVYSFAEKLKKLSPKSSAAHLAQFQSERTEMFKMKWEWEKEKHTKELELTERNVKIKEEQVQADIEFRRRELEIKLIEVQKDEKLKILEMEKQERLKKLELVLKTKSNSL